jgi:hypothetical protein
VHAVGVLGEVGAAAVSSWDAVQDRYIDAFGTINHGDTPICEGVARRNHCGGDLDVI